MRGTPGPKADPSARYSRHANDPRPVTYLPPDGCTYDPPPLPPGRSWTEAEEHHWNQLFRAPQAAVWDESVGPVVAALVVATSATLSGARPSAQLIGELRALASELGLTPSSMARLSWVVGDPPQTGTSASVHALRTAV
ncbi:hypothetical protein ACFYPK_07460 [Streptomyces halstedii]|uniref:phage terminase small subunit n=1 Tax=Streptomyces halstedii TaxID=1944 RepID=UPI0036A543FC